MKFFHSIRWRLQLWHAALLFVVLTGFGYTAWHLQWATLMQRIDGELEQRMPVVVDAMRRPLAIASPPSQQGNAPRKKRPSFGPQGGEAPSTPDLLSLSTRDSQLFAGGPDSSFYYAVWNSDGAELFHSASAPSDVSRPVRMAGSRGSRRLASRREFFRYLPTGECVLVGRGIAPDIRDMWRFAAMLAGAGSAVCALGLLGGWWISSRALRPITEISVTAQKIASGDLTQRIRTSDTDSELGQLVTVLNETFARLQAAFDRQLQFTADASHELRTPLSIVITQAQTALSRERTGDEYRECLSACQRAAQRMRQLIESLLTLARIDSGEVPTGRESCDLGRIALETCDLLRPLADENGIRLEVDAPSVCCAGNAAQLAQVISNLVGNAIHYNRPGGSVRVRITADGDAAVLCVQDTGQGIAADDLPHIFDRFYRSDKARSGSPGRIGLGLAIVQAIVWTHGGFIHVDTESGTGSTFTVRLPGKVA